MSDISSRSHGVTADNLRTLCAMRRWTPTERAVVVRGLFGRLAIAVEPAIISLLFAVLTLGLLHLASDGTEEHAGLQLLAPIFGLGAAAFAIYAMYLLRSPLRALRDTYGPIFVVDGYIRTRGRDDLSERGSNGYVAVLLFDQRVACEWPTVGAGDLPFRVDAALCEFTQFGGILAIDGKSTGALPQDFSNIGVGSNKPPR